MTIRTPYGGGTRQLIVEAKDLGEQKAAFSVNGDGDVKAGYDANHPFLASARNDVVTKACLDQSVEVEAEDRVKGDEALAGQISALQEGFDAAIIAGQEGAENINIELQSYLKKDDANTSFLKLTGGELMGNLISNALYKTTRNEGYAFQVRPNNGDTSVFIHTSGHIEASGYIKVDGTKVSLEDHTHSGYAASDHTHSNYATSGHNHNSLYVKGNWTITKEGGNWYIS